MKPHPCYFWATLILFTLIITYRYFKKKPKTELTKYKISRIALDNYVVETMIIDGPSTIPTRYGDLKIEVIK